MAADDFVAKDGFLTQHRRFISKHSFQLRNTESPQGHTFLVSVYYRPYRMRIVEPALIKLLKSLIDPNSSFADSLIWNPRRPVRSYVSVMLYRCEKAVYVVVCRRVLLCKLSVAFRYRDIVVWDDLDILNFVLSF